jgi:hypothetical protein
MCMHACMNNHDASHRMCCQMCTGMQFAQCFRGYYMFGSMILHMVSRIISHGLGELGNENVVLSN